VAHFAQRFEPGELARRLTRAGFTGQVEAAATVEAGQLQAIGEGHVLVTPYELLMAYHRLASLVQTTAMAPILEGLEGAVEFGTAQRARVARLRVAGKTGSVTTTEGAHVAWFAGFAPARAPEFVVTVAVQGRSGGADASPIAGSMLQKYAARRL
jgi:penicillin-binding protein 2